MLNIVKKLISRFTDKPIAKGYGISCDESITLPDEITLEQMEKPVSNYSAKYTVKQSRVIGRFEFVGFKKSASNKVYCQIRHIATGSVFTVDENFFNLIFNKCSIPKGKDSHG